MDFLDNAINKTKEVFDVAYKKAEETVTTGKQKFDISSLKSKREKDFAKLGEIYYNTLKNSEFVPEELAELVGAITEKNEMIKKLSEEIGQTKNRTVCNNCGELVENGSVYCKKCGSKIGE